MSEFCRFVAYIYEYVDGEKRGNAGYAKVTLRNGMLGIQLKIQTDLSIKKMKLYNFIRQGDRTKGYLQKEGESQNGIWETELSISEEELNHMGCPFENWKGLWITGEETEKLYISVWDDEILDVSSFEIRDEKEEQLKNLEEEGERAERESHMGYEAMEAKIEMDRKREKQETSGLAKRWHQFQCQYPHIEPFEDDELTQCIQIAPKDISFLGKMEFCYCNSPFVQQKYMKYQHLLLGLHRDGKFILAVPGVCRGKQDQHLAHMYGFPQFKRAVHQDENQEGEFGYWYHEIEE